MIFGTFDSGQIRLPGGTGSIPPLVHGLHRAILDTVSHDPLTAPWLVTASSP